MPRIKKLALALTLHERNGVCVRQSHNTIISMLWSHPTHKTVACMCAKGSDVVGTTSVLIKETAHSVITLIQWCLVHHVHTLFLSTILALLAGSLSGIFYE
jgi:hypothetical protein